MKTKNKSVWYSIQKWIFDWGWMDVEKSYSREEARQFKRFQADAFPDEAFRIVKVTEEVIS